MGVLDTSPPITEPFHVQDTFATGFQREVFGGMVRLTFYADRPAQWPLTGLERVVVAYVVMPPEEQAAFPRLAFDNAEMLRPAG